MEELYLELIEEFKQNRSQFNFSNLILTGLDILEWCPIRKEWVSFDISNRNYDVYFDILPGYTEIITGVYKITSIKFFRKTELIK